MAGIVGIGAGVFVAGLLLGAIVLFSIGVRLEEAEFRRTRRVALTRQARGPARHAARLVSGLYVRQQEDEAIVLPRDEQGV